MSNTFYVTTPIYYVNALPHIGNSYTTIVADVLARFERARGKEVLFLTGTDENAPKNAEVARDQGRDPQEFVDAMSAEFVRVWKRMDISYDQFIRTTEMRHINLVQDIFARLRDQGDIYKGLYEGYYCVPDETFWTDSQVVRDEDGVPHCPNPECRRPVQKLAEENYFFRLSAYGDRLLEMIETHPKMLAPDFRRNEVISFIKDGLRDVSITRKGTGWGIPVPGDPDFVVYVWFDALINYLTAVGYGTDDELFRKWWPANVQLMAKDIFVRFHCTFWPAMLMAMDVPVPERLFGHGYWTLGGEKISKSRGNAIDPFELAVDLSRSSGCLPEIAGDAIRYTLLREIPFGADGDFNQNSLVSRFNAELANDLGNLLNRTLSLVEKYFSRVIPEPQAEEAILTDTVSRAFTQTTEALEDLRLQDALEAIWTIIAAGNKYIDEQAPWRLHREGNIERVGTVLYSVLDTIRSVAILIQPIMPHAAEAIWTQLGIPTELGAQSWQSAAVPHRLPSGVPTQTGAPIFPRIDMKKRQEEIQRMTEETGKVPAAEVQPVAYPTPEPIPETPRISIDDFKKVQLVVARVLKAERVPKADKLLHLTIDVGEPEPRQLVAGIAEHYAPEDLIGQSIVVVANLQPARIRGIESNGMLLAAEADGRVLLLGPQGDLPPGAKVR